MTAQPKTVVEVSWEVVNKVGGINTVVKSKADFLAKNYDNYFLVGPYFPRKNYLDFKELPVPDPLKNVFDELKNSGVNCVYGTWLIKGTPNTILVDASNSNIDLNGVKAGLWERFKVDSMGVGSDYNDPLQWAWACGMLIEKIQNLASEPVVAHCHEWLAGFALLYLRQQGSRAGTVFTTHATMLGRTICANTNIDLYNDIANLDAWKLAGDLGVRDKFSTEVACAHNCDVFTTVSEITGLEAEHLLGRKPDVLLFNGIDGSKYPTIEEASMMHIQNREKIRDFLDYYFFSHYTFDLANSLIFFISGRYELRNKGMDVLTDALGKLNDHLKKSGSNKTVICFYYIPGETHGIKTELLEERAAFSHIQQYLNQHSVEIVRKILRNASDLDGLSCTELISEEMKREIAQMMLSMHHEGDPPLVTHNVPNENNDAIGQGFKANGLLNREQDKVKVIRYPIYLTGSDGLLDLTYTEAVSGSHMGIFPSYYEPWGYTPVEAAVMGVPAVTTDLAGFGKFMQEHAGNKGGIHVLGRLNRSYDDAVNELFKMMADYCELDKYGRNDQKLAAKKLIHLTEWETFIKEYYKAHTLAYEKHL